MVYYLVLDATTNEVSVWNTQRDGLNVRRQVAALGTVEPTRRGTDLRAAQVLAWSCGYRFVGPWEATKTGYRRRVHLPAVCAITSVGRLPRIAALNGWTTDRLPTTT